MTMTSNAFRRRARRYYSNNNDAFIPELWSMYTVAILEKHMVMGKLVFRDFENELKMFGDTVNTRKPAPFTMDRKDDADDIAYQDATATNIPVILNMHPYVSFIIKDGEQSLSMEKLVERYLDGAVKAIAQNIDSCVAGQWPLFLGARPTIGGALGAGSGGTLGGLSTTNYQTALAETVLRLDNANCPVDGRQVVVCPKTKSLLLQNQGVVAAYARGDGGTALETADMGMIYGVQHYMSQSFTSIGATDVASSLFVINNAAGYKAGTTASILLKTGTGALAVGQWFTLNGRPYRITAHTETLGNTTSIDIDPPLVADTANNDQLIVYGGGTVNNGPGYAAGWAKAIVFQSFTQKPKVGQGVSFGTGVDPTIYTIVQVDTVNSKVWLDRALEATVANATVMNLLPPGDYNLAFRRDAIALVCRPLEAPRIGAGAISVNVTHGSYPLRIVIAYDHVKQGHAVTIDCLMGVKVLDPNQGAVLLG